jgi:hypothetical protein
MYKLVLVRSVSKELSSTVRSDLARSVVKVGTTHVTAVLLMYVPVTMTNVYSREIRNPTLRLAELRNPEPRIVTISPTLINGGITELIVVF